MHDAVCISEVRRCTSIQIQSFVRCVDLIHLRDDGKPALRLTIKYTVTPFVIETPCTALDKSRVLEVTALLARFIRYKPMVTATTKHFQCDAMSESLQHIFQF